MSRDLLDIVVDLLAVGSDFLAPPFLFGVLLVVVTARRSTGLVGPMRMATISVSIVCSILSLGAAVYRPLGIDTPVPEVSIFAVAVVYALAPAFLGGVLVFLSALVEIALLLIRKKEGERGRALGE